MLELRGPAQALLDAPLDLRVRGVGGAGVTWRARLRDDDGRVWRATAPEAAVLDSAWAPAKPGPEAAALASLRPVAVEVRAETEDGRAAMRTVTRLLTADGVRLRRWRGDVAGTLHLPAGAPAATVLVPSSPEATLAAPLLASRGVLVLVLARGDEDQARALLAAVPGATAPAPVTALPRPPGVPAVAPAGDATWDALLVQLGARPR